MARKKKSLIDSLKEVISPKDVKTEEVKSEEIKPEEVSEEEFLFNEEALEELSNGKGEDDELLEPLADE